MCWKKEKITNFYTVYKTRDNPSAWLTVVSNKADAEEYIHKRLKIENLQHYKVWCTVHGRSTEDYNSWLKYFNTVLTDREAQKYKIGSIQYKKDELAAVMRVFIGATPIGCSFDTKNEYNYLKDILYTQKKVEEALSKIQDQLDDVEKEDIKGEPDA